MFGERVLNQAGTIESLAVFTGATICVRPAHGFSGSRDDRIVEALKNSGRAGKRVQRHGAVGLLVATREDLGAWSRAARSLPAMYCQPYGDLYSLAPPEREPAPPGLPANGQERYRKEIVSRSG